MQKSDRRLYTETGIALKVAKLVEPAVDNMGFRLVRVRMIGAAGKTLQIMIERLNGTITLDDCEKVSRVLSPLLDIEDPISTKYDLEVSSPGIDRPLVRAEDFERWSGHEAKIELTKAIDGRRRFRGVLDGTEVDSLHLLVESEGSGANDRRLKLQFADIAEARLVLTDELLKAAQAQKPAQGIGEGSDWALEDTKDIEIGDAHG